MTLDARLKKPGQLFKLDDSFKERHLACVPIIPGILLDAYLPYLQRRIERGEMPVPEPGSVQDLVIYNGGNLTNSFVISMFVDVYASIYVGSIQNFCDKKGIDNIFSRKINEITPNQVNLVSGLISSLTIGFAEVIGMGNYPDLMDIPAGVMGAALYVGARYFTRRAEVGE